MYRYLMLCVIYIISLSVNAANDVFVNGKYANKKTYRNKENKTTRLEISNAEALEITIIGHTEKNYDFLTIYDSNQIQIRHYSGLITDKFTVEGECIRIHFKSDAATVDEGVKVEIKAISLFHRIKTDLHQAINAMMQQGTGDIYFKINQLVDEFIVVETQLSQENTLLSGELGEKAAEQAAKIAEIYRNIAIQGHAIKASHTAQFEVLDALQHKTKTKINRLKGKQLKNKQLLEDSNLELENPNLPMIIQKLQISIDVTKKAIKALEKQEIAWKNFYRAQLQLIEITHDYSEKINFLLYFLNENSQLYELAAKNISLNEIELMTLNETLIDLDKLKSIVADIEASESEMAIQLLKIDETYITP